MPDENFSVRQYEEFHEVLHPLQHEALPRKDFAQIRSKAPQLIRLGRAIVKLSVPRRTAESNRDEFKKEITKFSRALEKFSADSKRGTDDQLASSYSAVHDSFEMLAGMLPRTKNSTANSSAGNSTYFTVRRDLRRCASPFCGGYFVKRVNQASTRCSDGQSKPECYVSEINWDGHPQVDAEKALLRGEIKSKSFAKGGKFGVLRVSESWAAAGKSADSGTFYRVKDRGLRCITYPCETHYEAKLNSNVISNIAGVDLARANASEESVTEANTAMTGSDGVVVAGSHGPVKGPGGKSVQLNATRFYLRKK
jgi:hypothetical protein